MNKIEKRAGLIAGISLIVMAIAAGFSYGYVHNTLVSDTPLITVQKLAFNKWLFVGGLAGWAIIIITDLIVTFSLYRFFKSTNRKASFLTAAIRFIYTVILGIAVFQIVSIIFVEKPLKSAPEINLLFASFEQIWSFGLIIFGLHLIGLGYLSIKSVIVPKFFGYLLYLGGFLYTTISALKQTELLDAALLHKIENVAALPMALAELLLAVWLIFKGFKNEKKAN
jgi:hypothetical protein